MIDYKFTDSQIPKLSLKERFLIYLYRSDCEYNRNTNVHNWYEDKKEAIFRFSNSFIHSSDMAFYNILRWDECVEYGKPYGNPEEGGIILPPNVTSVSSIPIGKRLSYLKLLKKLILDDTLFGFIASFRSCEIFGGNLVQLLDLWSESNRDKPKDIVAISLTEKGFNIAKTISDKYDVIMPWQLHKFIINDFEFAKSIYNVKK